MRISVLVTLLTLLALSPQRATANEFLCIATALYRHCSDDSLRSVEGPGISTSREEAEITALAECNRLQMLHFVNCTFSSHPFPFFLERRCEIQSCTVTNPQTPEPPPSTATQLPLYGTDHLRVRVKRGKAIRLWLQAHPQAQVSVLGKLPAGLRVNELHTVTGRLKNVGSRSFRIQATLNGIVQVRQVTITVRR